jgi:hypothetical protein
MFNFFRRKPDSVAEFRRKHIEYAQSLALRKPIELAKQDIANYMTDYAAEVTNWDTSIPAEVEAVFARCHQTIRDFFTAYKSVSFLEPEQILSIESALRTPTSAGFICVGFHITNEQRILVAEHDATVFDEDDTDSEKSPSIYHYIIRWHFPVDWDYVNSVRRARGEDPL